METVNFLRQHDIEPSYKSVGLVYVYYPIAFSRVASQSTKVVPG